MDPLTQTMELLTPRALLWKQLDASGDWIVRFPSTDAVVFSRVDSGRCLFQSADHGPRELLEGDFLLMTRPSQWSLADNAKAAASKLDIQSGSGVRLASIGANEGQTITRVTGGGFTFSDVHKDLLDELLPPFVVITAVQPGADRLRKVLDLLADEAATDQPGRNLAINRLLELMLIEVIRQSPGSPSVARGGLLAGLADPQLAKALRALHADVQRVWTVAELAKIACMSRSMFAEKFSRIVGLPPIDYLLRWRMALAKDALMAGRDRLAVVAQRCGYQSVSAFSAAFTRTVGCPPSRFLTEDKNAPSNHGLQYAATQLPNGKMGEARA